MSSWRGKACGVCFIPLFIGIASALLSLTSVGLYFEEEYGLTWLFKLRGTTIPPNEVVIVSIDKISAEVLRLPDNPEKWPRSYYAELIEKINRQNPTLIAINITFNESRDVKNDQMLAESIARGKNIILSSYLKQKNITSNSPIYTIESERFINPIPIIDQASFGTAPFPLPKSAETVKQFWTYTGNEAGVATFPTIVFQSFLFKQSYPEIRDLLKQINLAIELPDLIHFSQSSEKFAVASSIQEIQSALLNHSQAIKQLGLLIKNARFPSQKKTMLESWLASLNPSDSLYFNHYGKAGMITTVPFYQALVSEVLNPDLFENKIVLIGYSEDIEPEKNQGIYTVFSDNYSSTVSPIEIAATAVANLIDNSWLKPVTLWQQLLIISLWGIILFGISRFLSYKISVIMIVVFALGYIAIAIFKFTAHHVWMPLFIPIMIQAPFVLLCSSIVYFFKIKKEQQRIQETFSQFIPDEVVQKISYHNDTNSLSQYGEVMQGVCMATDAEQYTMLSETFEPQELNQLMNAYYGIMFPQVKEHGGIISDVIGDAMLAIWAKPEQETQIRLDACYAALKIVEVIDHFNASQPCQLPTRLGLHCGKIRLGNVGAHGHYEYRAVGDAVNTATRIEGLNKILGTQILVSSKVIVGLPGFHSREMGYFLLKGKKNPVHVYELITHVKQECLSKPKLLSEFGKALGLFQDYRWEEALEQFQTIHENFPNDKVTLFYINYLTRIRLPLSSERHSNQPAIINIGNITIPLEK